MKPVQIAVSTAADSAESAFTHRSLRQIGDWLDSLSRGNPEHFASELRQALVTLNASRLKKAERLRAVELFRPPVFDVCDALVATYRSATLPMTTEQAHHAVLVRDLLGQLADGFKQVVNERIRAWQGGETEDIAFPLHIATQRALLTLGRGLMERYRVYAPEPVHLWRDVHGLYRNAEIFRLPAQPIEGVGDRDETALSVKQAYLRIAVLAMANPYHLLQGEAEELYRRVGRWVHMVELQRPQPSAALEGFFLVDLASDLPPAYRHHGSRLPRPREPRVLNLARLVEAIEAQVASINQTLRRSKATATLSERMQRDMYTRFKEALGGRQERTAERRPTVAKTALVEGLTGCHFFLNGRRRFAPETEEAKWEKRVHEVSDANNLSLVDDSDEAYLVGAQQGRSDRSSRFRGRDAEADDVWKKANLVRQHEDDAPRQRKVLHRAQTWNRKNVSAGGMALFAVNPSDSAARVGELVAYGEREQGEPQAWRLGTIRWLRSRSDGGLEMGIKEIAPSGFAVGTKAVRGAGANAEYFRAILVPRINPLTGKTTLITPAGLYDLGTVLKVNMGELVFYAKLVDRVETTRLIAHFRFQLVEAPERKGAAQSAPAVRPAR